MKLVIVPNGLTESIYAAIDRELAGRPMAEAERDMIYHALLNHYDEHGAIPEFSLTERKECVA